MKGYLILEDQTIFEGQLIGWHKETAGEVVFTTGMVGYPETLTDPSFKGQIIVFTYPLIGNYGVSKQEFNKFGLIKNFESMRIHCQGIIVSNQTNSVSQWTAKFSFDDWLKKEKIPGLADIDTRALTQKIREKGTMLGKITNHKSQVTSYKFYDPNKENLVNQVSCLKPIIYKNGKPKILLLDCGAKASMIRYLLELKTTVIQVPWDFNPWLNKINFDGLVISNGPGDPKKADKTINIVKKALQKNMPILGICLGNQILALAAGGNTYKLKYGHRGQNQPCLLVGTKKAFVTSQNHGFSVKMSSLSSEWEEWFINLNDGTNEGIIHKRKPFGSIQFHPEANPGPIDTEFIFEKFMSWIDG